ncbi:MAG TPA: hypothetical protein VLA72_10255, partial [Anaerolineales bacterium]|nr:hypothetical protein [Anaerolineales bacterium]
MTLSPDAIEKILIGVITAIVVLILSESIKAGLKKIGEWGMWLFQSFGFGVTETYYRALTFDKINLPLIGRYKDIADPPKLEQVYISLKLNSETNTETIGWESLFRKTNKRIALIGLPGVGKTTLLN